ncbi:GTPase HflX [Candidatus Omnitrophota bacterium]
MHEIIEQKSERTILVGAGEEYGTSGNMHDSKFFEELRLLVKTAGAHVVGTVTQSRSHIDKTYYIGKGKAHELGEEVVRLNASSVIFDNDLTPAQVSNLQKLLEVKVIDRSGLILDIFALRARTSEAKTQVELAQLKYLLPRLTRQWTHLSRQVGGIGLRGPGETQLEVDRRRVRDRILHLTATLKKIEKQRHVSRNLRKNSFKVSLVGYTNSGKSTLLNTMSGADVPVENKLFKTLDSVTRLIKLKAAPDILLSDTVGFIRNLPHDLIASFRSTLEEVKDADLLLHVIDIQNPEWEKQIDVVNSVLADLGASETKTIKVFNKIDLLENSTLSDGLHARHQSAVFISAEYGTGLDALEDAIKASAMKGQLLRTMTFGTGKSGLLGEIYKHGTILNTDGLDDEIVLTFMIPEKFAKKLGIE